VWLVRADEELQLVEVESIADLARADENFVWIDLSEFAVSDLERLAERLSIDRRALHAAISPWQRPQVDAYRDHFFVSTTVARIDAQRFQVMASELDLVIGRNFLLSVHKRPLPFAEDIKGRAHQNPELVRLDSAYMLSIVLEELLEHYEGMVETLEDRIEALEERALRNDSETLLGDLVQLERLVFALGRIVDQHAEVFADRPAAGLRVHLRRRGGVVFPRSRESLLPLARSLRRPARSRGGERSTSTFPTSRIERTR
jgi:magnesium transporter